MTASLSDKSRADLGWDALLQHPSGRCHTLRRHLLSRTERAPRLLGRAALIAELIEVSGPIADAFDESGGLRDSASPALRGLRQRVAALQAELAQRAGGLLEQGHIAPYLQD